MSLIQSYCFVLTLCVLTSSIHASSQRCHYRNKVYMEFETMPGRKCFLCLCLKGTRTCRNKCIARKKECVYGGKIYKDGDSMPALDNCNTCLCMGTITMCTMALCMDDEELGIAVPPRFRKKKKGKTTSQG